MSSVTKIWTEEDFRKELRRLDQKVKRTQGIILAGSELQIEFSYYDQTCLGMYYPKPKKFKFSLAFFNSDVPEACAIDVIRHKYTHYYNDVVFGNKHGHGPEFKTACRIVGANPGAYYTKAFEAAEREKEERRTREYASDLKEGQYIHHPSFGTGVISSVENIKGTALLTIDFGCQGIRIIDENWLKKNGVI